MSILREFILPHPPIIIPEIGKGQESKIINTINSMKEVAENIKELQPETIIIITPHGNLFRDAVSINYDRILTGDFQSFGEYSLKFEFENDISLVDEILLISHKQGIPVLKIDSNIKEQYMLDSRIDHGALVPLYFIEKEYKKFILVHITYGLITEEELYSFGKVIKEAVDKSGNKAVVIASGDLSHKLNESAPAGYSPKGKEFDELLISLIKNDKRKEIMMIDQMLAGEAGECGLRSIQILMGTLDKVETVNRVLSYEGPFGVGYGVVDIKPMKENEDKQVFAKSYQTEKISRKIHEDEYVYLARKTVETYLKTRKKISVPENLANSDLYTKKAGVFVSLKIGGELRGCIGTIEPVRKNIAEEIINNALSSAFSDPRFNPVKENELDYLEYSVDVLMPVEAISSKEELDVKKYGIIVSNGLKKGLLLPNLDGIDTVDEQISIALKKAGINKNDDYKMERFEVIRHQ